MWLLIHAGIKINDMINVEQSNYCCGPYFIFMSSSHGNVFQTSGPSWEESNDHRWIPLTKGQQCGALIFHLLNKLLNKQSSCRLSEGTWCSYDVIVMNLFSQDVPLKGLPVDLRKYRQHTFSGVSITQNQDGASHLFCVSKKGFLFEIDNQRRIVRVQNLKVIDLQLSMV